MNGSVYCSSGCNAIVDSGTTIIIGPLSDMGGLLAQIGAGNRVWFTLFPFYVVDCDKQYPGWHFAKEKLNLQYYNVFKFNKDINFVLNGKSFAINQTDYIVRKKNS